MKQWLGDEGGASAVEFAIILPFLLVIVFGIIEFSLILFNKAVITNASREGARAGIVFRADPESGDYDPLSDDEIREIVDDYAEDFLVTFSHSGEDDLQITTTFEDLDGSGSLTFGDVRVVTVSYNYGFLVLPSFVTAMAGNLNLVAETSMRME